MSFLLDFFFWLFLGAYTALSIGQLFVLNWRKLKAEDMLFSIVWPSYRKKYMQKYIDPAWISVFCIIDWIRIISFENNWGQMKIKPPIQPGRR